MSPRNIVIGQRVDARKETLARELRRSMTEAETLLWQRLRANRTGGYHFRRQQVIAGFIVDFYCHAAGLVIELDGPVHEDQADYDAERDRVLQSLSLRVLRFQNQQVFDHIDTVLQTILKACNEALPPKYDPS